MKDFIKALEEGCAYGYVSDDRNGITVDELKTILLEYIYSVQYYERINGVTEITDDIMENLLDMCEGE